MNRIYRSIWNDKTGTFVATSENAKSGGRKSSPGATAVTRSGEKFALRPERAGGLPDAGVRFEWLRPAHGRRGVGGQREHRGRRRQDDYQPVEPECGDQLAELQHRTERSGPVRAAQQQLGSAQPGAGFRSFEHPRQPVGQRQSVPAESERHPVRPRGAGERGRAGSVHVEHHRRRLHGRQIQLFRREQWHHPQPGIDQRRRRLCGRCWARTSATKA